MMIGTRILGLWLKIWKLRKGFTFGLGFSVQSEDVEEGPFIDQVTGLDKVKTQMGKDETTGRKSY